MINAVNEQFSRFVSFAEGRMAAGKDKAIASKGDIEKGGGTTLEERAIYSTDKTDFVGMTILRTKDAKAAKTTKCASSSGSQSPKCSAGRGTSRTASRTRCSSRTTGAASR